MMKKFVGILLGLLLVFSIAGSANASLITNGSFEDPTVTDNGGEWQLFESVQGWSSDSEIEYQTSSLFGAAADGNQYVELDSLSEDDNPWLHQSIDTVVGKTYELSFAFSAREDWEENLLEFGAGNNGPTLLNIILNNVSGSNLEGTDWTYYNYAFVADSTSTWIGFRDAGKDDGYGTFIDDVSVAPVPEPATMLLFGLGLLGVAGVSRRKN